MEPVVVGFGAVMELRQIHDLNREQPVCKGFLAFFSGLAADYSKEIYSLGAKGDDGGAIMLVTRKYSGKAEIVLRGSTYTTCSVTKVQPTSDRGAPNIFKAENVAIAGSKIVLPVKENEIYLIRLF